MKFKFKFIFTIFFLSYFSYSYCYEIIRDPIFENYLYNINKELKLNTVNTFLIKSNNANAFVLNNNIYITTKLLEEINQEDTLKAIFLHEYGHIINNHLNSKKIEIEQTHNISVFYNLFSIGMAALTKNTNLGVGTSISLNSTLVDKLSKHSIKFEIEADNFMTEHIIKNEINTQELILFLNKSENQNDIYFRSHPRTEDRINNLKELNYKKKENSNIFEWIKSKYSQNSKKNNFNIFFENLEKGIFDQNENFEKVNKSLVQYEAFKKGFFVDNLEIDFQNLLKINNSSFLKIEYINYLLDNNLEHKYKVIDKLKFDKSIVSEYFYNFIFGKYYDKIGKKDLANFYLCQFYNSINSKNKADFFCKKYDIKDIPILDKSYALFK